LGGASGGIWFERMRRFTRLALYTEHAPQICRTTVVFVSPDNAPIQMFEFSFQIYIPTPRRLANPTSDLQNRSRQEGPLLAERPRRISPIAHDSYRV